MPDHAIEIPPALMDAVRHQLAQDDIAAVLASRAPLSRADRQALQDALRWWQEQQETARARVQAIAERLAADGQDRP